MDKKTEGAWVIHHANKLQSVAGTVDFQEIDFAGKCGVLLSALAADDETTLGKGKVEAIAKAAKLSVHTDLPAILSKLADQKLIDQGKSGIAVLGLTTSAVLQHTSDIFHSTPKNTKENAAIALAEETSRTPVLGRHLSQWVSDNCALSKTETTSLLQDAATIGFVDTQQLDSKDQLFFNGYLFRVENAKKLESVLNSLSATDRTNMQELEQVLLKKGCIEEPAARKLLGNQLFEKLHSIAVLDVSSVSNEKETTYYVTRPGAFGKYGNTVAEDALDLAKAFVSSLTYGMTKSPSGRGRIKLINLLLDKLIQGRTLNPSTAAGQDYRILELKGVVEVRPASGGMFTMRLLKKEVGIHAKNILNFGDASEASVPTLPGASVTTYTGPEDNRAERKRRAVIDPAATTALLNEIRTGALR